QRSEKLQDEENVRDHDNMTGDHLEQNERVNSSSSTKQHAGVPILFRCFGNGEQFV
ncbi:unnamed protein product, partial [Amoebophrya sp. A25]